MKQNKQLARLLLDLIDQKFSFFFWYFVRLVSALLPLYTIYLFGQAIKLLEAKASLRQLALHLLLILFIRILDNIIRLLSIHQIEYHVFKTEFSIHQFLLFGLKTKDKHHRHQVIQAIRNFSEAVRTAFSIICQPGIDGLVSFIGIPVILFFLDFKVFVAEITYVAVYIVVDIYTTQHYSRLKNIQNAHTENYYAKLQDTNNVKTEQKTFLSQLVKLCRWGFFEWNFLQNTAVIFYSAILFYLIYSVSLGAKQISDLVLVMGYVTQTQVFLNNLSSIKDRLADTKVALLRLAQNKSISTLNLPDLT